MTKALLILLSTALANLAEATADAAQAVALFAQKMD
jgi:hypothetical protein